MKVTKFKCPHCNADLGPATDAYLYGSPFQTCKKCKKTYVDNRYHEIAIEGIRQEDINPTENDKKNHRQTGLTLLLVGVGSLVLFIVIIALGFIVYPLPVISIWGITSGIKAMKSDTKKSLEKRRAALEIEKQQSFARLQNPEYVEKLRSVGYSVPSAAQTHTPASQPDPLRPKICKNCQAELGADDVFCANCGTHN